jgi:cardiolipin synthase
VNRSRTDGGDSFEGDRFDGDRYEERADYRDLDAQQAYEDPDYAEPPYVAPRGRRGRARAAQPAAHTEGYEEYPASGDYVTGGYTDRDNTDDGYQDDGYVDDGYEDDGYEDDEYENGHADGRHDDRHDDRYDDEPEPTDRIFTIPNLISLARLACVPLFLGLILSPYYGGPKYDQWALLLLALSGFSDWLDGKLARRWNQMSKLGAMLDPLADRLYIFATLVGLTMRDIIPLWLPIVLIGRDAALLTLVPKLRRAGFGSALPVHFLGKAATFNLLYAFPLLLLGQVGGEGHKSLTDLGNIFGWAFVGWGTALYLLAGGMYFIQAREVTRGDPGR